ncbi:MAG: GGDEF domain-containing protein [Planctomycetales bacterium]|nr:GGDEF domain-containing protein [Planctomycetales bacterium]
MMILLALFALGLAAAGLITAAFAAAARGAKGTGGPKSQAAQQALDQLQQLAGKVAVEIDEHSLEMQQIASSLKDAPANDQEALSAVTRLVQINQRMQQQLSSAEEKLQAQSRQMEAHAFEARTDALTQVANRRSFDDVLARRIEDQQRRGLATSVMLLDVDHFKKFNDTHGHQAGDEVLRHVASVLRKQADADDLVARYGGEEFAVVFSTMLPTARAVAERARAAIGKTAIRFEGRDLRVAASAGIAELQPGEDQLALIKRADSALYAAKNGGRNCLYWNDGHQNHHLRYDAKLSAKALIRDDLTELLGMDWTTDTDELSAAVSTAAEAHVSSKPVFIDDMIRRLAQWKRDQTPLCLILAQIDGFAELIQKQREIEASTVLRVVAQIIQANMRDMDHVSRLGNDTFSILLPATRLADGIICAERLRRAAEHCRLPTKVQGFSLRLSIGVVETFQGDDMRAFLQRGRNALQVAIDRGRNRVYAQGGSRGLAEKDRAVEA